MSGYLDVWMPGCLDTWIPGYLDTWIPGYLRVCMPHPRAALWWLVFARTKWHLYRPGKCSPDRKHTGLLDINLT